MQEFKASLPVYFISLHVNCSTRFQFLVDSLYHNTHTTIVEHLITACSTQWLIGGFWRIFAVIVVCCNGLGYIEINLHVSLPGRIGFLKNPIMGSIIMLLYNEVPRFLGRQKVICFKFYTTNRCIQSPIKYKFKTRLQLCIWREQRFIVVIIMYYNIVLSFRSYFMVWSAGSEIPSVGRLTEKEYLFARSSK